MIVNDTHLQLLTHFKAGSIVGPKRVNQTSANHSKILKTHLAQITGDKELDPYSLRHTGKHLADIKGVGESQYVKIMFGWKNKKRDDADKYAAAGHFAAPLIKELRAITALMLEDHLITTTTLIYCIRQMLFHSEVADEPPCRESFIYETPEIPETDQRLMLKPCNTNGLVLLVFRWFRGH